MCPQRHASCPGPPPAWPALTRGAVRRTFMSGCPRAPEEASCNVMQNRVKSPNAIRRGWRQPRRGRSRLKACRAAPQPGGMVWTGRVGCRKAPVQPGPRRMWPGRTAADRIAARTQYLPRRMLSQADTFPDGWRKKQGPPSRESPVKGSADVSRSMACAEARRARQRPWTALPVLPGALRDRPGREPLSGRTDAGCANSPS